MQQNLHKSTIPRNWQVHKLIICSNYTTILGTVHSRYIVLVHSYMQQALLFVCDSVGNQGWLQLHRQSHRWKTLYFPHSDMYKTRPEPSSFASTAPLCKSPQVFFSYKSLSSARNVGHYWTTLTSVATRPRVFAIEDCYNTQQKTSKYQVVHTVTTGCAVPR